MRKFLTAYAVLLAVLGGLAGCGRAQPGNQVAYQEGSDRCTSEFVSNFNTVINNLASARTVADLDRSQSLVTEFKQKYRNVVCQALLYSPDRLADQQSMIRVNEKVSEWNSAIEAARANATSAQ